MTVIGFEDNRITIAGTTFELQYTIREAFGDSKRVIVLFDPDSKPTQDMGFQNLVAVDENGKVVWKAELPTDQVNDLYYKIAKRKPLIAYSRCSFECRIDEKTGSILKREFYK